MSVSSGQLAPTPQSLLSGEASKRGKKQDDNDSNYTGAEDDLWLGVCVYSESESEFEKTCETSRGKWVVEGDARGVLRVYCENNFFFILFGHGEVAIRDIWTIYLGDCLVLLSLDVAGTICWWGLESGECIDKLRLENQVMSACFLPEKQVLYVLLSHTVMVVDINTKKILYEIGGGQISSIRHLSVDSRSYLVCCVIFGGERLFDLESKSFVEDDSDLAKLLGGKDGLFRPIDALGSSSTLVASQQCRFQVGKRFAAIQIGKSEIFICIRTETLDLEVMRANELPLLDSDAGKLGDPVYSESSYLVVAKEACSESGIHWIYVALPCSAYLLLYQLDMSCLQATLLHKIDVDLTSVDAICLSPFEDNKVVVIDSLFDQTLVVLGAGYETVNRVYFGSSNINTSEIKWTSPFVVDLGNRWTFDLLSECLQTASSLYSNPFTVNCYPPLPVPKVTSSPTNRYRSVSTNSGSTVSTLESSTLRRQSSSSSVSSESFPSGAVLGINAGGINSLKPRQGIHGWTLHIHKINSHSTSLFSLMSFFMHWNIDDALDADIEKILDIRRPSHTRFRFLVDNHKKHKMFSLLADSSKRWVCSDKFTALQTLGLVSLFISLIASQTLSEHQQAIVSSLVSHYGIVYPEQLIQKKEYIFPCLDVMSRFILSERASEDVQIASRLLLQVSIERMPSSIRMARAAQWAARLHVSEDKDSKAVIVLGMMGVTHPEDLAPATARVVAQQLRLFIPLRKKEETVIAAELLARGFYVWCPYIDDLPALVRDLIVLYDFGASDGGNGGRKRPGVSSMSSASQRALIEIGSAQPLLFIQTLGKEALKPGTHRYALTALSNFIKKKPLILLRLLPAVVEIVIKTLDPSESDIRKACLKFSTVVLHQLVKRYSMVSFHQETQRFAVGTVDSIILIYDLRTATKWRILEGHTGPVSAVSFEPSNSGEKLVSYSAQEGAIRLWQTVGGGFFGGLLGINGSCVRVGKLAPLEVSEGQTVDPNCCSISWEKLVREDGTTTVLLEKLLK